MLLMLAADVADANTDTAYSFNVIAVVAVVAGFECDFLFFVFAFVSMAVGFVSALCRCHSSGVSVALTH